MNNTANKLLSLPESSLARAEEGSARQAGTTLASSRRAPRLLAMDTNLPVMHLPMEDRPLAGRDIERFKATHDLQIEDVIYTLAFATMTSFNKASSKALLPYDREVLIRLFMSYPGPAPWRKVSPREAFFKIYGDLLSLFDENSESFAPARTMLFSRFTAMLGRSVFRGYSWIEGNGKTDAVVSRILQKVCSLPNSRDVLENVARNTWRLRGVNLDVEYPLPDPVHPPLPKPKGKQPSADKALYASIRAPKPSPLAAKKAVGARKRVAGS